MNIGDKIRSIRKSKGLSQIEVAKRAQIAVNSLRNYELGKRQPNMDQLHAIANALGVSMSEFFWVGDGFAPEPLQCIATPHGSYIATNRDILDDIDIAFYGDYKELSEDDKETLRAMARVMRERRAKKEPPQD